MYRKLALSCALFGAAFLPVPFVQNPIAWAQTAPAANPLLHPLFSDDAILQRDRPVPVWGWTAPGSQVTVKLDAQTVNATADAAGRWQANVGPQPAGGPHTLTVTAANGETVTRSNILFGDVWVCSGQSNMEFGLGAAIGGPQAAATAPNFPQLRLFTIPKKVGYEPQTLFAGSPKWQIGDQLIASRFSAVGFYFGRKLQQDTKIPIGLIHSSWGGTIAEAWTSAPGLKDFPEFKGGLDSLPAHAAFEKVPYTQRFDTWQAANDSGAVAHWEAADFDDSQWKTVKLPSLWAATGVNELTTFQGSVWLRREVDIPAELAGKDLTLRLGGIADIDKTYWNGAALGNGGQVNVYRTYTIPGAQVKAGRNVIAINAINVGGRGGLMASDSEVRLEAGATRIPLAGPWKYSISSPLKTLKQAPPVDQPQPNQPSVLFNGMIAPLEPFAIKGAIWYQGESNGGRGEQYGRLLPALIADWRQGFQSPLSFYIVQLSSFGAVQTGDPKDEPWPRLRESQLKTSLTVPNTGLAVSADVGNPADIHPKDKETVGLRLAYNALAKDYSQQVEYLGPTLRSSTVDGPSMRLTFDHTGGALTLKGDTGRVFALAGADQVWHWAKPEIQGDTIVITAPEVTTPVAARFGWQNSQTGFLYNAAGLPASQFRTDDWPVGK